MAAAAALQVKAFDVGNTYKACSSVCNDDVVSGCTHLLYRLSEALDYHSLTVTFTRRPSLQLPLYLML